MRILFTPCLTPFQVVASALATLVVLKSQFGLFALLVLFCGAVSAYASWRQAPPEAKHGGA